MGELAVLGSPVIASVLSSVISYMVVYSYTAIIHRVADATLYCHLWGQSHPALVERMPTESMPEALAQLVDLNALLDPISHEIMTDPVVAADGHSYERSSIAHWFQRSNRSPITNLPLAHVNLVPNHALRKHIEACGFQA